jgi:hypothetical protein
LLLGAELDNFYQLVIGSNNDLYLKAGRIGGSAGIYAFDKTGQKKWFVPEPEDFQPQYPPAIGPDGTIYSTGFNHISAISPDGKLIPGRSKTFPNPEYPYVEQINPRILISQQGTIYLHGCGAADGRHFLFALDPQLNVLWSYEIPVVYFNYWSLLVLSHDENVIYLALGSLLVAVDSSSHSLLWQRRFMSTRWDGTEIDYAGITDLAVGEDETLYVVVHREKEVGSSYRYWADGLHAISPDNPQQDKWLWYEAYSDLGAGPIVVSRQGHVFVAISGLNWWEEPITYLHGFDSEGQALPSWGIFLHFWGIPVPIVLDAAETLYVFGNGQVRAYSQTGLELWTRSVEGYPQYETQLALDGEGNLYLPATSGLWVVRAGTGTSHSTIIEVGAELQVSIQVAYGNAGATGVMKFIVKSQSVRDARVEVFDLSGKSVFATGWIAGNVLEWHLLNTKGQIVSNGVYLYVITMRGYDGQVIRSEVRKLVVLR